MTLDDPEVREFLARSMVLRLAALSPKGRPNVRCLWFVCRRGRIYIFTANTSPTGRSVSAHPDVVLLFDGEQGSGSTRLLRVQGRAVFRSESGIVARVMLGLARKYFLTQPGLRNLLAHAGKVPLALGFYALGWRDERGKGLKPIMEVMPESFEFIPPR
jgi:uncharacterized pyridoxamine 5'-phosphate oxidase family protein